MYLWCIFLLRVLGIDILPVCQNQQKRENWSCQSSGIRSIFFFIEVEDEKLDLEYFNMLQLP